MCLLLQDISASSTHIIIAAIVANYGCNVNKENSACQVPATISSSNMPRAGSGKWARYNSDRRYHVEWEKDFPWLTRAWPASNTPLCKWCHTTLQAKRSNLAAHTEADKHKRVTPKLPGQSTAFKPIDQVFPSLKTPQPVKDMELQLAVSVACHSAISSIDHLGEVLIKHGENSVFAQLKMHRTKCSKLITCVISPAFKAHLKNQLRGQKFAILVDANAACYK